MSWHTEFGDDWDVPSLVRDMVARGEISDDSWHNDAMPKFGVPTDDDEVVYLTVEHVDPARREYDGERFSVYIGQYVLHVGDDIHAAVRVWRAARWLFHVSAGDQRPAAMPASGACGAALCERANVPFDVAVAAVEDPTFCGMQTTDGDWVVRLPPGVDLPRNARGGLTLGGREYMTMPSR